MLNKNLVPSYLKQFKLIMFTKNGSYEAEINDTQPIMVLSYITKILEKAIKSKKEEIDNKVISTQKY